MGCSSRSGPTAGTGSTRTRTRCASPRCEHISRTECPLRRRPNSPAPAGVVPGGPATDLAGDLWAALDAFDDAGAQNAFDRLVAALSFETLARVAVLPYLQALGERWRDGDASVAQEHFASAVLRGRLLGLARGWDRGLGPRALLACPPGERHDLGLVIFGLALRERGWRVTYLGPDTPIETIAAAAETLAPEAVVLCALTAEHFEAARAPIVSLAGRRRVHIGGAGADANFAGSTGTHLLAGDPLTTAAQLSG